MSQLSSSNPTLTDSQSDNNNHIHSTSLPINDNNKNTLDSISKVIIVGAGVFGVSTAIALKKRLERRYKKNQNNAVSKSPIPTSITNEYNNDSLPPSVLLLDIFPYPSEYAASNDLNRIVRADYGNDLLYTHLALESIKEWKYLNSKWKEEVYHETGLLLLTDEIFHDGLFESDSYNTLKKILPEDSLERIQSDKCKNKFSSLYSGCDDGYYNSTAGWVDNGRSLKLRIDDAIHYGVDVKTGSNYQVNALIRDKDDRCIGVSTVGSDQYYADVVIVAVGAWLPTFLPSLSEQIQSSAQPCLYVTPTDHSPFPLSYYSSTSYPVLSYNLSQLGWYTFPLSTRPIGKDSLKRKVIKIANHCTGLNKEVYPSPAAIRHPFNSKIQNKFDLFIKEKMPWLDGDRSIQVDNKICYYADTKDGDWLIDWEYGSRNKSLAIIGGDSGHAFKFLPLLGELVCSILFQDDQSTSHWKENSQEKSTEEEEEEEGGERRGNNTFLFDGTDLINAKHRFRWKNHAEKNIVNTDIPHNLNDISSVSFDHCRAPGDFESSNI